MSAFNDVAGNRSKKRVARAGRESAARREAQVLAYLREGYAADEIVEIMREYYNSPVKLEWVKSLSGN